MTNKAKELLWTDDMIKVIADNHETKTSEEITIIINKMFGTNKSSGSVRNKGNRHGYTMTGGR